VPKEVRQTFQLRAAVRSTSGPEVFMLPEVIEYLELTRAQQQQILQIVETNQEIEGLAQLEDVDRSEVRTFSLWTARRQAFKLLDPAQQERWRAIFAPRERSAVQR
jgi:hypothetical protein